MVSLVFTYFWFKTSDSSSTTVLTHCQISPLAAGVHRLARVLIAQRFPTPPFPPARVASVSVCPISTVELFYSCLTCIKTVEQCAAGFMPSDDDSSCVKA